MRLLMISSYFASHLGGLEIVADRLFREFTRQGLATTWLATDATSPRSLLPGETSSRTLPLPAFHAVERGTGLPFPIPRWRALRAIAREVRQCDAVLIHDCLYLCNIFAYLCAKYHDRPAVIVQHIGHVPYSSPVLRGLMTLGNRLFTRPMLARADRVIFISDATRRHFTELAYRNEPITIYNGVDSELFHPAPLGTDRSALRQRFGLAAQVPVALFVGRFVEKKGLGVLERLAALDPKITWAFAGSGPLDPRHWGHRNVAALGEVRGSALADLYRASDLLVLPSIGEGFPLVIQEALASGIPVVCGDEALSADPALHSWAAGLAVDIKNPEETAQRFLAKVRDILEGRDVTSPASARPVEAITERYSWARAASAYRDIFASLTLRNSDHG